jgi:hypothetical protein
MARFTAARFATACFVMARLVMVSFGDRFGWGIRRIRQGPGKILYVTGNG